MKHQTMIINKQYLLLLLVCSFSYGQYEGVNLKQEGKSIQNLVPKNWKIINETYGDLNKDGIKDLVFVIQNTDSVNIQINDLDTIDSNPRVFGIYFKTKKGNFIKKIQSDFFIPIKDSPVMDEPLDGIRISKKGVLEVDIRYWYSMGSWFTSSKTYKFRYQKNKFVLIGFDTSELQRNTGETTEISINVLTKKIKTTFSNISRDSPISEKWEKLELNKLVTLDNILEFDDYLYQLLGGYD